MRAERCIAEIWGAIDRPRSATGQRRGTDLRYHPCHTSNNSAGGRERSIACIPSGEPAVPEKITMADPAMHSHGDHDVPFCIQRIRDKVP